jgi:hypothetical protein
LCITWTRSIDFPLASCKVISAIEEIRTPRGIKPHCDKDQMMSVSRESPPEKFTDFTLHIYSIFVLKYFKKQVFDEIPS